MSKGCHTSCGQAGRLIGILLFICDPCLVLACVMEGPYLSLADDKLNTNHPEDAESLQLFKGPAPFICLKGKWFSWYQASWIQCPAPYMLQG